LRPRRTTSPLHRVWLSRTLCVFVACLVLYGVTAGVSLGRHSLAPHFIYLAESLLRGRLDLIHVPAPPYDLTGFEGRWYVSFPPLPALLMLPAVAIRGLDVSDIAFSVVLGALGVSLFYAVLVRQEAGGWGGCSQPSARVWLCVLLGLGTPLWYCAALGSVWYTAHVAAVVCLCLYAREVMGRNRPALAGFWLGMGFLARAPVLLAFPLSVVPGLRSARGRRETVRFLLSFALGVAPALLGQMAYNWARFDHPLEFGYRWMNSPGMLLERQATWGQFSLHFLPENLYTLLIRPPLVSFHPIRVEPDPWGMGLLFTCPALLLALPWEGVARSLRRFSARAREYHGGEKYTMKSCPPEVHAAPPELSCTGKSERGCSRSQTAEARALRLGLLLSIALVMLPSLLYFNTGSYQFGYRFALDWIPLGALWIALKAGSRLPWWGRVLVVAGVLTHLWGVLWMYPNFNGQPWYAQYAHLLQPLVGMIGR